MMIYPTSSSSSLLVGAVFLSGPFPEFAAYQQQPARTGPSNPVMGQSSHQVWRFHSYLSGFFQQFHPCSVPIRWTPQLWSLCCALSSSEASSYVRQESREDLHAILGQLSLHSTILPKHRFLSKNLLLCPLCWCFNSSPFTLDRDLVAIAALL